MNKEKKGRKSDLKASSPVGRKWRDRRSFNLSASSSQGDNKIIEVFNMGQIRLIQYNFKRPDWF